jgi:hypothetical protein
VHCKPSPFNSIYHHKQSIGVALQLRGQINSLISMVPIKSGITK